MKTLVFTKSDFLSEKFCIQIYTHGGKSILSKTIDKNMKIIDDKISEGASDLEFFKNAILPQFSFLLDRQDVYIVFLDNKNVIVASLVLGYSEDGFIIQKNKRKSESKYKYEIKSVCVEIEHQGKGLSKKLIEFFFDWAKKNNVCYVKQSAYTKQGLKKIKRIFSIVSKLNPEVFFKNTSKRAL